MEKGINLSLTRSLVDFDALLDRAIKAVTSKDLSEKEVLYEMNVRKFQVGKYVEIVEHEEDDDDGASTTFWIGYGWEEKEKSKSCFWLEFEPSTCRAKYWDKIYDLVGTSGKYYHKIDFKFVQKRMNAWVYFFLREEYLSKFYDEKIDLDIQKEILTGFISEVLEKI